jgi:hypothetical protein
MSNFPRAWRKLLRNMGWYLLLIAISIALVFIFRQRTLWWLPWLVMLAGGGWLIWQQLYGNRGHSRELARLESYRQQAQAYQAQIDQALKTNAPAGTTTHSDQLASQIEDWTAAIEKLVDRVGRLRQDDIIQHDLKTVPEAIAELETRLRRESNPEMRTQLERTLANRRKQLAALEQLQSTIQQAEAQIESTVSLLGTIYSQILTGQSTSHVADYNRLSTEVDEEVRLLQDRLEALREVKLGAANV